MVLSTSSAQYAFLQLLSQTYYGYLSYLNRVSCMGNPSTFLNCSDPSVYTNFDSPRLPAVEDLNNGGVGIYSYTDLLDTRFYGYYSSNFSLVSRNITTAAVSVLTGVCASSPKCSASYNSTTNASAVVQALAQTNVNTIQYVLNQAPHSNFIPAGFSYLSNIYVNTADLSKEVYGLHYAILEGIIAGKINASAYRQQLNLANFLSGGFAMYEDLIHRAAAGSYNPQFTKQGNINLTGVQVFTGVDSTGTPDRKMKRAGTQQSRNYQTKWDVWQDEAHGVHIADRELLLARMKERHHYQASASFPAAAPACSQPSNAASGVQWLGSVLNTSCTYQSSASYSNTFGLAYGKFLVAAMAQTATSSLSATAKTYATNSANLLALQVTSLCAGGSNGYPCYGGKQIWQVSSAAGPAFSVFRDVQTYSNPGTAVLGAADLFCAVAPIAARLYKADFACCASDCNSPSCQTSISGCSQGTGVC